MICSTNGKWKIGNDVRNILLEDPDITAMVGTKIFPLIAPENTVGDFLIYMRESTQSMSVRWGYMKKNASWLLMQYQIIMTVQFLLQHQSTTVC